MDENSSIRDKCMKVTVCELGNGSDTLDQEWRKLAAHVQAEGSDLVVLPEMPFYPWVAWTDRVDARIWQASVEMHDRQLSRFEELGAAMVISTRPVIQSGKHLNEGYVWDKRSGYKAVHHKYYLPDDEGWWEASWYERGEKDFTAIHTDKAKIGFLICTELWFGAHAREYMMQGVQLLVCPRASGQASTDKWIAGGRTAAVVSGAYCLSSNLSRREGMGTRFGGCGWIIEPEDGRVLGTTSKERPFLTLEIDLRAAEAAKKTYPRYVCD